MQIVTLTFCPNRKIDRRSRDLNFTVVENMKGIQFYKASREQLEDRE